MTDVWGVPLETLRSTDGSTVVRYARDFRDGEPIAEILPGCSADSATANLLLQRLPGWQVAAEPELGHLLLDAGATTVRHAHTLAVDTFASEVAEIEPPEGLRVVPLDVESLDPMALLPSQRAAYPPDHPDHDPDVGSLLGLLVLIMGGDILGPLLPESALVVDHDDTVVAGLIINRREGRSPAGGAWVSDVWRDPTYRGLGTVLLSRAIASMRLRGEQWLTLTVTEGNPARERYERLGFVTAMEALRVRLPAGDVPVDRSTAEDFYWETWHLQPERVHEVAPGVMAARDSRYPGSFAHNGVFARHPLPAHELIAAADSALADVSHRAIDVMGDVPPDTVADLTNAGFEHQPVVLMTLAISSQHADFHDARVAIVSESDLSDWQRTSTRQWLPNASDAVVDDLVNRRVLLDAGSTVVRFGARLNDVIVGSIDLLIRGPVAELDALGVHPDHRNLGLGDALLSAALAEAYRHRVRAVVLSALTEDWPREWYSRRGFAEVGYVHEFLRNNAQVS